MPEQFRVGDKVRIKKDCIDTWKKHYDYEDMDEEFVIENINPCEQYDDECESIGCPGPINDECFWSSGDFILERDNPNVWKGDKR